MANQGRRVAQHAVMVHCDGSTHDRSLSLTVTQPCHRRRLQGYPQDAQMLGNTVTIVMCHRPCTIDLSHEADMADSDGGMYDHL